MDLATGMVTGPIELGPTIDLDVVPRDDPLEIEAFR
jgi:hypothetical protein